MEHADTLKEYSLGTEALGRTASLIRGPIPSVRAEASRLRQKLALYYAVEGRSDSLLVTLPKGSYAPIFEIRSKIELPAAAVYSTTDLALETCDRRINRNARSGCMGALEKRSPGATGFPTGGRLERSRAISRVGSRHRRCAFFLMERGCFRRPRLGRRRAVI